MLRSDRFGLVSRRAAEVVALWVLVAGCGTHARTVDEAVALSDVTGDATTDAGATDVKGGDVKAGDAQAGDVAAGDVAKADAADVGLLDADSAGDAPGGTDAVGLDAEDVAAPADVTVADVGVDVGVDDGGASDAGGVADDVLADVDAAAGEDVAAADAADADDAGGDVGADTPDTYVDPCVCDDGDLWTLDGCDVDMACEHVPMSSFTVGLYTGPAAGAGISLPKGAIDDAAMLALTIVEGTPIDDPGYVPVGPAVKCGPTGTQFALPVTVNVPYDPAAVAADMDLLVLRREDDTGDVTWLLPSGVNKLYPPYYVGADTSNFSTFQAVAVQRGKVLKFVADKVTLPPFGGAVKLTLQTQLAESAVLTMSPTVAGVTLPTLTPTSTETTTTVTLPANPSGSQKVTYTFTLTVLGLPGSLPVTADVTVDVLPNQKEVFKKVVSGWNHFLGLTVDGHVVCWGFSTQAQCVVPAGLADVKDIAASATASLALKTDGTIVQWGDLGQPYTAAPAGGVAAIAGGETHFLAAMSDGTVQAWNSYDNQGAATVPAGIVDVVAVAAGNAHSVVLKKDGTVDGWGADYLAQVSGPKALTKVKKIVAGRNSTMVLDLGGHASFFGYQGNGAYAAPSSTELTNVQDIAASMFTQCVLKSDGTLLMWSADSQYKNISGPAGNSGFVSIAAGIHYCVGLRADGSIGGYQTPGPGDAHMPFAALGLNDVVAVDVGQPMYGEAQLMNSHTLALRANGTVVAWSNGGTDVCGESTVPDGLTNVVAVASGGKHSLALKSDGTVVGWGCGEAANVPADVTGVTAIAAGSEFSLGVLANGSVRVWGSGPYNYMWDPVIGHYPPPFANFCGTTPCADTVQPTNVQALSAGIVGAAALQADGTVSAWGKLFNNTAGAPQGLGNVTAIDVAGFNAIALRKDGTIAVWGLNPSDPGDPDPISVTDAVAVAVGSTWNVGDPGYPMGGGQWYAVRQDGTLYASGRNLMLTTTAAKSVTGAVAISAGEWEGAVVRNDGSVWAWGMMAIGAR